MKVQILTPFFIYLLLLIIIGIFTTRSVSRGMSGFFLGERKINRYVIAISSIISARGAWLMLGVTTQAYIMGFSSVWLVVGFILSEFFLIILLAPALRKYSEENNCLTIIDLFTSRFIDKKKSLRLVISASLLFFSLSFITSQFIGGGKALYAFIGLSYVNGIIITGVITLLFTILGGFKTLNNSDVFHAFIILAVLISLPVIALIRKDGYENLHSEILYLTPAFFDIKALSLGALAGFLSIGLGSPGNPNILVKYMSINEPRKFHMMAIVSTILNILIASGALCIGMFARAFFPASDSIPGADPQNVYIGLAGIVLPPVLLGVVLTSIFAAVMSSAGSQILVSGSTVIIDLYEKSLKSGKRISQAKLKFYSTIAIVILVYIAIAAGIMIDTDFYRFVLFACAGLGAAIGPALILTLFWKGATNIGVRAGVITGSLTVIIWKSIPFLSDMLYEFAPGFILATLAIWIVSRIDKMLISRKFNRQARYETLKKSTRGIN